jgi:hypothetical protein
MSYPEAGADTAEPEAEDSAAPEEEPEDSAEPPGETGEPPEEEPGDSAPPEEEPEDSGAPVVDDPPPEDDCDHSSDLIYVIDKDTEQLYLFDPSTLELELVGEVDCDSWSTPASMGVSRDGMAYIRFSDDSVHALDLSTLACSPTSYRDSATDFGSFGMGYATDSAETWRDHLYIANEESLALLDTSTFSLRLIADMPGQAELTGNAAGELWALFPLERPAAARQIDPHTGEVGATIELPDFPRPDTIDTFAFAAWGGELYAFVRTSGVGNSTDVYRIDESGEMTRVVYRLGINVVGAGVSTCAPSGS